MMMFFFLSFFLSFVLTFVLSFFIAGKNIENQGHRNPLLPFKKRGLLGVLF